MKQKKIQLAGLACMILLASLLASAQQTGAANTTAVVPPLVRFSGTLNDANGKPLTGVAGVTFLLYKDDQSGAPLWLETQNVTADKNGHYTVMLGSTTSTGLPTDIFVAGEARWLAVHPEGQPEQPRVLLLSEPYALKAGDAQTLGGLPASAFVLAAPPSAATTAASDSASATASESVTPATTSDVTTSGGRVNTLPLFSTATNIQNSLITQTGTAAVNIGGKLNLFATGTATASAGKDSQPLNLAASAFNSSTKAAVAPTFALQAESSGNDTAAPSGTLNLLYGSGTAAASETGLKINNKGQISFAPGQTFPGVADLGGANAFTGNQSVTGTVLAISSTSNGIVGASNSAGGYGVMGQANNVGVYGLSTNGAGLEGTTSTGVAGLFTAITSEGTLIQGKTGGATVFTVDHGGNVTASGAVTAGGTVTGNGPNAGSYGVAGSGPAAGVYGSSASSAGFGIYGTSPNVGLRGEGTGTAGIGVDAHGSLVGVKGVATTSGGFSGAFGPGPVSVAGNGNYALVGDPGCGSGYAGLGFTTGTLSHCTNYALIGGPQGDTFINSSGTASIHFRNQNAGPNGASDLATIDNSGNLTVTGTVHGGNVAQQVTASNAAQASKGGCLGNLTSPNSTCQTPGMSLTVKTSGGPVLIMANIGAVVLFSCVVPNFHLVMDNQFIGSTFTDLAASGNVGGYSASQASLMSLQTPNAGSHTFQVQESDDRTFCGGTAAFTLVSGAPWYAESASRTLIVREF